MRTRKNSSLTEEEARFYSAEIVVALLCLQEKNVTHRDIKPSNIMLDREGHIKVMDFGLATTRRENLVLVCGTPEYVPPRYFSLRVGGSNVRSICLGGSYISNALRVHTI